ncbi:MAG: response regulator [SAR324 cluster bacterium]|nr:response regulator [SAR324 cluster bacterium]
MTNASLVHIKDSIATQLLKVVFSVYIIITLTVTFAHLGTEFFNTKKKIVFELKVIGDTFGPSLAQALWDINLEQLQPMFLGMVNYPTVVGTKLINEHGVEIGASGVVTNTHGDLIMVGPDGMETSSGRHLGLFHHSFPIIHHRQGKEIRVGEAIIYSSNGVVFEKVKLGFYFIVINSIIKTLALWILFLWASRRFISRPLSALTDATQQLSLDRLDDFVVNIKTKGRNELKILEESFNRMVQNLISTRDDLRASYHRLELLLDSTLLLASVRSKIQALTRVTEIILRRIPFKSGIRAQFVFQEIASDGREGYISFEISLKEPPGDSVYLNFNDIHDLPHSFSEEFPAMEAEYCKQSRLTGCILKEDKLTLSAWKDKELLALIVFENVDQREFKVHDREFLETLTQYLAITLVNLDLIRHLESTIERQNKANQQLQIAIDHRKITEGILQKYEYIVGTTKELIGFLDKDYRYGSINESFLTALNKSENQIVGHSAVEIHGREVFEKIIKPHLDQCLAGEIVQYESWFQYEGIGRKYMDVKYFPFFENGNVTGVVVNGEDITESREREEERLRLEEQSFQSQKMESIGTMAGGIAHDLNNSLQSILMSFEIAFHELPDDSSFKKMLEIGYKNGIHARDLVKQILTFSRQEKAEHEPLRIDLLIRDSLQLLSSILPKNIEIRETIEENYKTVMGNATQLQQVLINLCTNAGDAMREKGGILTVKLLPCKIHSDQLDGRGLREGDYLKITISDTGDGISPEIRKRIFDPFFTTKPTGKGTGLGLAVVHGIIKNHQGDISLESEIGKGTSFDIFLPAIEADARQKNLDTESLSAGKGRILFVDDEKDTITLGGEMLSSLGYDVLGLTRSTEALDAFRKDPGRFDLVITDQTMPQMTGMKLSQELLKVRPDLPIILTTGFSDQITPEKLAEIGIKKFLTKPYSFETIIREIQNILDKA